MSLIFLLVPDLKEVYASDLPVHYTIVQDNSEPNMQGWQCQRLKDLEWQNASKRGHTCTCIKETHSYNPISVYTAVSACLMTITPQPAQPLLMQNGAMYTYLKTDVGYAHVCPDLSA